MDEDRVQQINNIKLGKGSTINKTLQSSSKSGNPKEEPHAPSNQLKSGLLGWYAVCSIKELEEDKPYFFTMYNEPLMVYKDKDSTLRCIKDLCPHRGASFRGGEIKDGELVCPYHGARFSSTGKCTNLGRITCNHIVDNNYNNYAAKIHLHQYLCKEVGDYIFIHYTGSAKTNLENIEEIDNIETKSLDTYGFKTNEYAYEEVIVDFKCDWSRIIENHLDILHLFWVHGDTIPDTDVNRDVITSFNQEITRDNNQIESKYKHKDKDKSEFIRIKFLPPGRIIIYKGQPEESRYLQVLDHIPLERNQARVIVRHYRRFLKNKFLTDLILFKNLQHRIFYKVFAEDYLILRTQTFNEQMGYIEKDNVKLLGEDKMIQYYWDWFKNATNEDKPWQLHPRNEYTNTVHDELNMIYPPENDALAKKNIRSLIVKLALRVLVPIGVVIAIL